MQHRHSSMTRMLLRYLLTATSVMVLSVFILLSFAPPQSATAAQDKAGAKGSDRAMKTEEIQEGSRALVGRDVRNMQNEIIGEIQNVIVDDKGRLQKMVVSVGGFWGMGAEEALVPIDKFNLTEDRRYVFFKGTQKELEAYSEYNLYGWAGRYYPSSRTGWSQVDRYPTFGTPAKRESGEPEDLAIRTERQYLTPRYGGYEHEDVRAYTPEDDQDRRIGKSAQRQEAAERLPSKYDEYSYLRSTDNPMLHINWEQFGSNRFQASQLLDKEVRNSKEEKLGRVDDIIFRKDGRISLVLAVGEALNQGDKKVQADLQDIRVKPKADYIVYDVSKEELKNDPSFTQTAAADTREKGKQQ